jgi:mannan endo-1,4-beta-mannosidase
MRSRLIALAASSVAALALGLAGVTAAQTGAQAAAPVGLHIENGKLVERNGTPFVARGVSHMHTWYASQTATAIPAIKAAGANALRVVLSSGNQWTKNDLADVTSVVSQCKASKLICMLEVHDTTGYGEAGAAVSLDTAVNYWISIKSALVGQEDYVQLNIGNEPYGNGSNVSNWTADTSAAIKKLRSNGFRNLIVVDAPNWGQDWSFTMRDNATTVAAADPDANTMFSVHMYGVFDTAAEVRDYLAAFTSKGLPITIGEFGNMHSDGDPDEDTIMSEAQRLGIGYYGWAWSGNGGGVEYLDMVTGFNPSQLTPWGQRIINGANGIKATAREATIYGGTNPTPTPTTPTPTPTTPTPTPTTPTPTTTAPGPGCTATFKVENAWSGGFQGSVAVKAGSAALKSWSTSFTLPSGVSLSQVWNGVQAGSGSAVTVTNAAWNGSVGSGATATYGFLGSGTAPTGTVAVSCTGS